MKRFLIIASVLLLASISFASIGLSDEWNGVDALPQGYVLCEKLSLREASSAGARLIAEIPYGDSFAILGDVADCWLPVVYKGQEGYVLSDYVVIDPEWYTVETETAVYAMPSNASKRVGLLTAGEKYMIIGEYESYYTISLRGAAGFILKEQAAAQQPPENP